MLRRSGYRVLGPTTAPLAASRGRGGPPPGAPPGRPFTGAQPPRVTAPDPTGISQALGAAAGDLVAAGSVLLGVILIVAGLLMATGMSKGFARAGLRAASRGVIG